jgi:hypothetical protein
MKQGHPLVLFFPFLAALLAHVLHHTVTQEPTVPRATPILATRTQWANIAPFVCSS